MFAPSLNAAAIQRRLFLLAAASRLPLAISAGAYVVGAGATVGQMLVAAHLIVGAFSASPSADAARSLVWLLVFVVVRALAVGVSERAAQRVATQAKSGLRLQLVRTLIARGPNALTRERTGEVVTTAIEGIEKLDPFYRRFVPQAIATTIVPVIIFSTVAWIDPLSGLLLAITGPLIPVFMWLLGTLAERRTREQWGALSRLGGHFLDTLQGLPTLTSFGRSRAAASDLVEASEQLRRKTMGVLRVAFLSGFVLELTASMSTAVVAASVGVRLIEGWLSFEPALAALLLAPEFYLPFRQFGQKHHAGMEGVAAAERVFALLDVGPVPDGAAETAAQVDLPASCSVKFDRVSVIYPESERAALRDITLNLEPRSMTAVIGPSGAGKSTLIRVLLRFIEPDAGTVSLDGRTPCDIDAATWRRHISLVPQRPRFIDGSILDNLRIARPGAAIEEVIAAAKAAGADAFIAALPNGYGTHVDETASALSGGERQRLAIARALLKPAPILILDEPTASLDARNEALVAAAIARIAKERTVLVIAHRLGTIRDADTVVVLDAGRIVDRGAYAQVCGGSDRAQRVSEQPAREVA